MAYTGWDRRPRYVASPLVDGDGVSGSARLFISSSNNEGVRLESASATHNVVKERTRKVATWSHQAPQFVCLGLHESQFGFEIGLGFEL